MAFTVSRFAATALPLLLAACPRGNISVDRPGLTRRAAASVPDVIDWALGEGWRVTPRSARGVSIGLVLVATNAKDLTTGRVQAGSCTDGLRYILPVLAGDGVVLGSFTDGSIRAYRDGEPWKPLPTSLTLPPVDQLVGFVAETSPLELLVGELGAERLWSLALAGDSLAVIETFEVTRNTKAFRSREDFLHHYHTGRCINGDRDCMFATVTDEGTFIDREPHPQARHREPMLALGSAEAFDFRYASAGEELYVLTDETCSLTRQETRPSPDAQAALQERNVALALGLTE